MTKSVYIASSERLVSKSSIALGVIDLFARQVRSVGVFRPLVHSVDSDAVTQALLSPKGVNQSLESATGVTYDEYAEDQDQAIDTIRQLADHPSVVCIGETGLDYYQMQERKGGRSVADLDWQRQRFRTHIRAARRTRLPLVIHTRAAAADTLRILDEEGEDGGSSSTGGVFHCFTETLDVARAALERGFYISFSGIVTFRNARELREVVPHVPDDRLLIETDSPWLAPVPHRGKLNSPAYVPHVAACVAELRGVAAEAIAEQTSANFDRLFLAAAA